jgi:hypothetical protein
MKNVTLAIAILSTFGLVDYASAQVCKDRAEETRQYGPVTLAFCDDGDKETTLFDMCYQDSSGVVKCSSDRLNCPEDVEAIDPTLIVPKGKLCDGDPNTP